MKKSIVLMMMTVFFASGLTVDQLSAQQSMAARGRMSRLFSALRKQPGRLKRAISTRIFPRRSPSHWSLPSHYRIDPAERASIGMMQEPSVTAGRSYYRGEIISPAERASIGVVEPGWERLEFAPEMFGVRKHQLGARPLRGGVVTPPLGARIPGEELYRLAPRTDPSMMHGLPASSAELPMLTGHHPATLPGPRTFVRVPVHELNTSLPLLSGQGPRSSSELRRDWSNSFSRIRPGTESLGTPIRTPSPFESRSWSPGPARGRTPTPTRRAPIEGLWPEEMLF